MHRPNDEINTRNLLKRQYSNENERSYDVINKKNYYGVNTNPQKRTALIDISNNSKPSYIKRHGFQNQDDKKTYLNSQRVKISNNRLHSSMHHAQKPSTYSKSNTINSNLINIDRENKYLSNREKNNISNSINNSISSLQNKNIKNLKHTSVKNNDNNHQNKKSYTNNNNENLNRHDERRNNIINTNSSLVNLTANKNSSLYTKHSTEELSNSILNKNQPHLIKNNSNNENVKSKRSYSALSQDSIIRTPGTAYLPKVKRYSSITGYPPMQHHSVIRDLNNEKRKKNGSILHLIKSSSISNSNNSNVSKRPHISSINNSAIHRLAQELKRNRSKILYKDIAKEEKDNNNNNIEKERRKKLENKNTNTNLYLQPETENENYNYNYSNHNNNQNQNRNNNHNRQISIPSLINKNSAKINNHNFVNNKKPLTPPDNNTSTITLVNSTTTSTSNSYPTSINNSLIYSSQDNTLISGNYTQQQQQQHESIKHQRHKKQMSTSLILSSVSTLLNNSSNSLSNANSIDVSTHSHEKKKIENDKNIITDISFDPISLSEYSTDIFNYMKELELKTMPNPKYMDHQKEVTWSARTVLVDWIVQVHWRFKMQQETLFLTVNLIDRFLSARCIKLDKLQLLGVCALLISAKYEEMVVPSIKDLVFITDNAYSSEEIIQAERCILVMLEFDLGYPGPMNFLRRISKADGYDIKTRTLAKYLIEITLLEEHFLHYPPSVISSAAMLLARKMIFNYQDWNDLFIHYSGYTEELLIPVAQKIINFAFPKSEHPSISSIKEKYSISSLMKVSTFVTKWIKNQSV